MLIAITKRIIVGNQKKLWNPAVLKNSLTAWYDAADVNTMSFNGSNITQWDDLSGNNNHATQSNASYQPLYDSANKYVSFNLDYMNFNNHTAQAGVAVISNANGYLYGNAVTPIIGDTSNTTYPFLRTSTADYTFSIDGDGNQRGDVSINGGNLTPGNGTGANISISGYVPFPTRSSLDLLFWQYTAESYYFHNILVGWGNPVAAGKININEIILLASAPSQENRQKLEGYLAHKWGITSNLPSGHTYKYVPPKL